MMMSRRPTLTLSYLNLAPRAAAEVLQALPPDDVAAFLDAVPARLAAPVIAEMVPFNAARCLEATSATQTANILRALPFVDSTSLFRLIDPANHETILDQLSTSLAKRLRSSQRYPRDQVGAWTDASVPILRTTDSVADARRVIGQSPVAASHIFLASSADQTFAGALTVQDLLRSENHAELGQLTAVDIKPITNRTSLSAVAFDPGWDTCLFLPVVGRRGTVLGGLSRSAMRKAMHAQHVRTEQHLPAPVLQMLSALAATVQGLITLAVGGDATATRRPGNLGDSHVG
jgi:Mg/Co/Ni transporter MgtE